MLAPLYCTFDYVICMCLRIYSWRAKRMCLLSCLPLHDPLPMQSYVFHSSWWHTSLRVIRCKKKPFNKYKHILATMDPQWPPLEKSKLLEGVWPQVEKKGSI